QNCSSSHLLGTGSSATAGHPIPASEHGRSRRPGATERKGYLAMTGTTAYAAQARLLDGGIDALSERELSTLRTAADALLFADADAASRLARAERLLSRLEESGRLAPSLVEELHVALRSIAPDAACV